MQPDQQRMLIRLARAAATAFMLAIGTAHGSWASILPLMPWPQSVSTQDGNLVVEGPFIVSVKADDAAVLARGVARFQRDVQRLTGVSHRRAGPALNLLVDPSFRLDSSLYQDEAYRLTVEANGVSVEAATDTGILRALATVRQLIEPAGDEFSIPYVIIEDFPRFAWRGVMIDTARHFVELETLKRQIDAMERMKLNVLHLHLTDNEAFRIESRRFPRLVDSAVDGRWYTQAELAALDAYARDRGVRLVPEINLPGHAGAILRAYPDLAAGPFNPDDPRTARLAALDPTREETYAFVAALLEELVPVFDGEYIHLGGDQVPEQAWVNDERIAAFMAERGVRDAARLQAHFLSRITPALTALDRTPVVWEEAASAPIDDSIIVQTWRSSQAAHHVTAQGNPVLVSAGFYLDRLWPGADHYSRDPLDLFATPPETPDRALGIEPDSPLDAASISQVKGGIAALWTEMVTDEMVDGRLWPRAALIAERFWSAASVDDIGFAHDRLIHVQTALEVQGLDNRHNRLVMAGRLAPGDPDAVDRLAALTEPVRNMGRLEHSLSAWRNGEPLVAPEFNALADIAAPDSLEAMRINSWARAVAGGDATAIDPLRAALRQAVDNHSRFVAASRGVSKLEVAVPVSAELYSLAETGLCALNFIESGTPAPPLWLEAARDLLAEHEQRYAASESRMSVLAGAAQPEAHLNIAILPAIEVLVLELSEEARR